MFFVFVRALVKWSIFCCPFLNAIYIKAYINTKLKWCVGIRDYCRFSEFFSSVGLRRGCWIYSRLNRIWAGTISALHQSDSSQRQPLFPSRNSGTPGSQVPRYAVPSFDRLPASVSVLGRNSGSVLVSYGVARSAAPSLVQLVLYGIFLRSCIWQQMNEPLLSRWFSLVPCVASAFGFKEQWMQGDRRFRKSQSHI